MCLSFARWVRSIERVGWGAEERVQVDGDRPPALCALCFLSRAPNGLRVAKERRLHCGRRNAAELLCTRSVLKSALTGRAL